jgi:rare lipoprotein A
VYDAGTAREDRSMPFSIARRTLLALALIAPLSAAHPTETAPAAKPAGGSVAESFGDFAHLPTAPTAVDGAVDLATIEHTHADTPPAEPGAGTPMAGGVASYYARQFHGRRTASGERFDMAAMTAAHRTLPFGSKVRVTNPANGQSVVVRINDRGPFHQGRIIDVSEAAAKRLGLIAPGKARVTLDLLD